MQYPAGQAAPAQAALPVAQEIQPVDKQAAHGAQAAGSQVAQVVQQVAGQEANHVAHEFNQSRHKHLNRLSHKPNSENLR